MKTVLIRFVIAAVLVLTSVSVCLSNDNGCDDRPTKTESQCLSSQSSSQEQTEDHHCLCSMSCNNLFVNYSTTTSKISTVVISTSPFIFIQVTYPQVLISLDKPPIV